MKLVLYDISLGGHHGSYLAAISKEATARKWQTSIVVPKSEAQHPQLDLLRSNVGSENVYLSDHWVKTPVPQGRLSLFSYHTKQRKAAFESLKPFRGKCDFVYASNIDYMAKAISFFGAPSYPAPFGGMYMRARFHMKGVGVRGAKSDAACILELISFRSLLGARGVSCITTADPSLADFCQTQRARKFRKISYIPEIGMDRPSVSREEARARLGFTCEDRVILVYGAISKRKGIEELLEAVGTLDLDTPIKVLVAGSSDEAMQVVLRSRSKDIQSGRLRTRLAFADLELENAVFAAADAVWVAYRGHSTMSGVFYQAICCGLPVIAPNYGILDWLAEKEQVGISVDIGNAKETGKQISALLVGEGYKNSRNKAEELAKMHSPQNFGRCICNSIEQALSGAQAAQQNPHAA